VNNCLVRLTQLKDQLPPAQCRAVAFLLDNTRAMSGLTISRVAEACGVSNATLVRLCKMLGYKGFKDFSLALSVAAATHPEEPLAYEDIQPTDDLRAIAISVTRHNQAAITDTMSILNEKALEKTVSLLHKARRVDFYGVGVSALVAMDAQMKFQRLGKETQTSLDSHIQVVTAASLKPGDAGVLFSYTGETGDTLETLKSIRRSGATAISITGMGHNRLSSLSDIALFVAASETLVRSAAMSSRMSMMHLVDVIFSAVAARGYEQYKLYLDRTHREGRIKRRAHTKNEKEQTF
jgi:DNA-binding MurR/RpiR family transcriptional regulator